MKNRIAKWFDAHWFAYERKYEVVPMMFMPLIIESNWRLIANFLIQPWIKFMPHWVDFLLCRMVWGKNCPHCLGNWYI